MNTITKKVASFFRNLFTKTKKFRQIPQGKEYENWLGV